MTVKPTTQPRIVRSSLRTPAPAEVYDLLLLIGAALLVPALLLLPLPWLRAVQTTNQASRPRFQRRRYPQLPLLF